MAYTVLARRYRSATFDEVVGQDHVARTLKKAIESGRVAHAYLFNGTRGVGKTSMARIMAKSLNCEKAKGPTTQPCLECSSCLGIARGDDIDVIEIDAASNTGVDNIRELIENSQYRPARARYKIYIIDEVHMLSKSAFNALLKTLEEPPDHVKFILATTEPEKVLPTIHSRCQRYDFRNIPTREIAGHLKNICKAEKIDAADDALLLVAKSGAGSMRDSLSLLDRLLSIGEKELTVETIEQLLGLPKSQAVFDLVQAIGEGRVKDVLQLADRVICEGLSPDSLVVGLTDHLRNLLIVRTCGADSTLVEAATLSLEELARQAGRFEATSLSQDITLLEDLRRQMRQSGAGRALLDASLVRLALSEQFTAIADLLEHVDGGGTVQKKKYEQPVTPLAEPTAPSRPVAAAPVPPPAAPQPVLQAPAPATATVADVPSDTGGDDLPAVGRVWEGEKRSLNAIFKQSRSAPPPAPAPAAPSPADANLGPVDPSDLKGVWKRVLSRVREKEGLWALLSHARLADVSADIAVVMLGSQHATFAHMLARNGKKEQVAEALTGVLDRQMGVRFEIDAAPEAASAEPAGPERPNPGAARASSPEPESPAAAVVVAPAFTRPTPEQIREMEQDPLIAELMNQFGADIIRITEE